MPRNSPHDRQFSERVGRSARRRIAARTTGRSTLSWLGAFGVIGWSVALPTLAGIALGLWLDARYETGSVSLTLTLMIVGLVCGIAIAWGWVRREGGGE